MTTRPESAAPLTKCDALPRAKARTASEASVATTRTTLDNRGLRQRECERVVAVPSLFNTTCNILHPPLAESEPIYIDDAPTHRFRLAVAAVVAELGWQGRSTGLGLCGRAGIEVTCGGCSCPTLVPYRCGARTCPTCARASAAGVSQRIASRITLHDAALATVEWDGPTRRKPGVHWECPIHRDRCKCWQLRQWRLVTLTRRSTPGAPWNLEAIRAQVKQASALLAYWWKLTEWGRQVRDAGSRKKRSRLDTSCVWGLEIAPGGMVHFHVIVYGEYLAQSALHRAWRAALAHLGVQDPTDGGARVEALRGGSVSESIREVLKYATKGAQKDGVDAMPTALQAGIVEVAFRSIRRTGIKGALRKFAAPEILDTTLADLHDDHVMSCEACGVVGEWHFGEIVGRNAVHRNNGYGLLRIDALGNDYGGWIIQDKPDIGYCDEPLGAVAPLDRIERSQLLLLGDSDQ